MIRTQRVVASEVSSNLIQLRYNPETGAGWIRLVWTRLNHTLNQLYTVSLRLFLSNMSRLMVMTIRRIQCLLANANSRVATHRRSPPFGVTEIFSLPQPHVTYDDGYMQSRVVSYHPASALHVALCVLWQSQYPVNEMRCGGFPLRWRQILPVAAISVSVTKESKEEVRRGDSGCLFSVFFCCCCCFFYWCGEWFN